MSSTRASLVIIVLFWKKTQTRSSWAFEIFHSVSSLSSFDHSSTFWEELERSRSTDMSFRYADFDFDAENSSSIESLIEKNRVWHAWWSVFLAHQERCSCRIKAYWEKQEREADDCWIWETSECWTATDQIDSLIVEEWFKMIVAVWSRISQKLEWNESQDKNVHLSLL